METLSPVITHTTVTRTDNRDAEPCPETYTLTETVYNLDPTDSVFLGLSALHIDRGNRYGTGKEERLTISNYGSDVFADAVIDLIRNYASQADPTSDAGTFCRDRAAAFIERVRAALPPVAAEVAA